jgi:SET domain-containing protein
MLLIKAIVKPSPIHGLGLFADEPIAKGTRIWQFSPGLDLEIGPANFDAFDQRERAFVLFYGFKSKKTGQYHLSFDNVRFINHAEQGNVAVDRSGNGIEYPLVAARDIQPGEELVQNYFEFDEAHQF